MTIDLSTRSPQALAVQAHHNAILRCWTRETGVPVRPGALRLELPGRVLTAAVTHTSPTGRHDFADVLLDGRPVAAEELVRLLSEAAGAVAAEVDDLATRVAESVRNVAAFVNDPGGTARGAGRFLDAEQALTLGHLHHPAPKSRDGLDSAALASYSPELGGRFAVHWFEADAGLVSFDQVTGSLNGLETPALMAALAGRTPEPGTRSWSRRTRGRPRMRCYGRAWPS